MVILTCEPNLTNLPNYIDEADVFFNNPDLWLDENVYQSGNIPCPKSLPLKMVMYDRLYDVLHRKLSQCYKVASRIFHSHVPESRVGKYMMILSKI